MSERQITISASTLLTTVATGLLLVLLWQLRWLMVVMMIAIVIASTLAPAIARAERLNMPRWIAVILTYLALIGGLVLAGLVIGPTVAEQIERLVRKLPNYLEVLETLVRDRALTLGLSDPMVVEQINQLFDIQAVTSWGFRTSQELLIRSYSLTRGFIGGTLSLILALLLSGYLLSGSQKLINGFVSLFPAPWDQRIAAQFSPVSQRMGSYIQGRILVSAILGVVISVALRLMGLAEVSLGLGVIAGFTNLIPFFGPVLGAIPALLVAIAQGGWLFLWVLLLFLIVQNVETYVLDPLLVGNSVRVLPIFQLLAVLGGTQVLGIIGALIVPPWIAGAGVVLENLYLNPKAAQLDYQATSEPVTLLTSDSQDSH